MGIEKILYVGHRHPLNMAEFAPYRRIAVGVRRVDQRPQMMPHIPIGLVETNLLELFHHYATLHLKAFLAESQRKHPVALGPECRFLISGRNRIIEIGEIVGCPCIVGAAGHLKRIIIVRDINGAAEHQMFEQMSHTGQIRRLIACPDIIEQIKSHAAGGVVAMVHHTQSVFKLKKSISDHSLPTIFTPVMRISSTGRSNESVAAS